MSLKKWYTAFERLNLNFLLTFIVVAEEKSFRRAAARMYISQSAISVQIRTLESSLGVPLFHRTTRSVALTREGLELLQVTNRMGQELADSVRLLREESALQRGTVSVAALPSLSSTLLPRIIRRYRESHPEIDVRLFDMDSKSAAEALRQRDVDLGLLPQIGDPLEFSYTHLFFDDFVGLAPGNPSVFPLPPSVSAKDLSTVPLLLNPKGVQLRTHIDKWFQDSDCVPNVHQECMHSQTLMALVSNTLGVTILPKTALMGKDLSGLRLLKLKTQVRREIGITRLKNTAVSPVRHSFERFLEKNAETFVKELFQERWQDD